jgi:transcriptional regulator of met regulon
MDDETRTELLEEVLEFADEKNPALAKALREGLERESNAEPPTPDNVVNLHAHRVRTGGESKLEGLNTALHSLLCFAEIHAFEGLHIPSPAPYLKELADHLSANPPMTPEQAKTLGETWNLRITDGAVTSLKSVAELTEERENKQ